MKLTHNLKKAALLVLPRFLLTRSAREMKTWLECVGSSIRLEWLDIEDLEFEDCGDRYEAKFALLKDNVYRQVTARVSGYEDTVTLDWIRATGPSDHANDNFLGSGITIPLGGQG